MNPDLNQRPAYDICCNAVKVIIHKVITFLMVAFMN